MYIWVLLATFITILYSFNLSTRSDMRALYVEPQAEAVVSKVVIQHKGAIKYVQDKTPPTNDMSVVSYYPGQIPYSELKGYLPYGFNGTATDTDFKSVIYCINKDSPGLSQPISSSCPTNQPSCCSNYHSVNYLVTYGCVPQRWRNIKTGKPNNDLLNAMQNVVGLGTDFGYADVVSKTDPQNQLGSTMAVKGRETTWVAIPQYVIDNNSFGGTSSFAGMCAEGVKDAAGEVVEARKCSYCLIYISPFE